MFVQVVEGVKELLLRAFFAAQHVDIVYQQHVRRAVEGVKLRHPVHPDTGDHLVHETLAGRVDDPHAAVIVHQGPTDRMHQVSLAHAHA